MAIRRFVQTPKTATFEDMTIGVRMPTTGEMLDITRSRQEYIKTVNDNKYGDGEGEIELWMALQMSASKLLACDPEDPQNPWFADDKPEQDRLAKNGVFKDLAEEVPHRLHVAVWNVLTGVEGQAPLETPAEETETKTSESTIQAEISSDSIPLSSESQSTSDAQSATLSNGIGTDS